MHEEDHEMNGSFDLGEFLSQFYARIQVKETRQVSQHEN